MRRTGLIVGGISALFLLITLPFTGAAFSDTNVYLLMGSRILGGELLYRDMLHTNLPLFPYVAALYQTVTAGSVYWYYATSLLECVAGAFGLFLIVRRMNVSVRLQVLTPVLYLFSFTVLITSQHQTGIFTASLLAIYGYYLYLCNRFVFSGILFGLMLSVKGYFLPVWCAIALYDIISRRYRSWSLIVPATGAVLVTLIPTILSGWPEMMQQLFGYSAIRPAGLDKLRILMFFGSGEWLFLVPAGYVLYHIRRYTAPALVLIFVFIFVLLYRDIYYFYLNMFLPFLVLSAIIFLHDMERSRFAQAVTGIAGVVIVVSLISSLIRFLTTYAYINSIDNYGSLEAAVLAESPDYVYGSAEFLPLISYTTGIPILNGMLDTNLNMFRKGIFDAQAITEDIIKTDTVVIGQGIDTVVPVNGQIMQIQDTLLTEIYDKETILESCEQKYKHPVTLESAVNEIHVYTCPPQQ